MWKKKSSLNVKVVSYFLFFSVLILTFLWAFQVLFLDSFYKMEKTNEIKQVVTKIKLNQNSQDFLNIINDLSFEKEVCVEITNDETSLYSTEFFGKGCMREDNTKKQYREMFINSNKDEMIFEINNKFFNSETILYAVKLNNNQYAFVNTSLEPIDNTAMIIRKQLIIITFIVFILSFIISYFISKHLSNPIIKLNKQTKSIAKGDFSKEFNDESNILEINELTDTLNYTRKELSKTEELRRDLMANVSHDLKTPLTMIKAYAEMATDLHANNKKKQQEDMQTIISETDRLTLLVEDILDLSKIQSDTDSLNIEEFDLIDLINTILKKYNLYQEIENYKFIFNHKDKKLLIKADKKKLEQVIYNLINNAINYTGEDNTVTINITNDNNIKVEIKDTGKGIKEEDLPYIWDRYYKNKKKHKRNLIGTGLGLSIVKSILEQHNFEYGVDTKINKGTTFYFIIKEIK